MMGTELDSLGSLFGNTKILIMSNRITFQNLKNGNKYVD